MDRNARKCAKCSAVIESHSRHDWVSCPCGAIFVDGGHDYRRWGGEEQDLLDPGDEPETPRKAHQTP